MHGDIPPERFFAYLTWHDIATMPDKHQVVILQPMGAIEQHGYHLPLVVDSVICTAVVGQALAQLPAHIPAYALPPLYYGKSNEHNSFSGTISLSTNTMLALLTEVAESVYRAGFRKLVLVNAHGGQPQLGELVARDLHEKYPDFWLFPLFIWRVPHPSAELFPALEVEQGIHGGAVETSVMLSLLPETVKMEQAQRCYPPSFAPHSLLTWEGKHPVSWITADLSATGVIGDATLADKAKGDRLMTALVAGWVQLIQDIYHWQN
jgi:creatinine amidohydrolase